ncbi:MAG: alanine racemase [Rhodobacter sp.]|nr:alanine racemase [Rhodobacter sp.]MCY4243036.1 alanine racemase [Rhodobacter sp.]
MFLDLLIRRNPEFVRTAIALHRNARIPANAFVLDLDAVERNTRIFQAEASGHGLTAFAMTKQVGRHSGFCTAVMKGGIERSVAVDVACAVACDRAGLKTGHLGHLVQVPAHEAAYAATRLQPDFWTVFSDVKAREAAAASARSGREQRLMARIQAEGDTFYRGHEGGFDASEAVSVANRLDALDGARFAGLTTFPALLFDRESRTVKPTPNLNTLARAAEALAAAGRADIEINAPGTTSSVVLPALADAGATQVEPGNGLHGTTPLHAVEDLPEDPAVLYLTEVSHHHGGKAYCFGGGLYIDPVFTEYQVRALVSPEPTVDPAALLDVEIPDYSAIDYYAMIDATGPRKPAAGDTVVFGFRGQAFTTRAMVVGVRGISSGQPRVTSVENGFGQAVDWPGIFPE